MTPFAAVEPATRDQWYAVAREADLGAPCETVLLGETVSIAADGTATDATGRPLAAKVAYAHLWLCPGTPPPLFALPEIAEPDRRIAACGAVRVRASGLRLIENFLDLAHFPFVHTGVLGEEARPEVPAYKAEIRRDVDEVWATDCRFWQPQAALGASGGQMTDYTYRVPAPFNVILYKTCPLEPARMDVIALFVQPVGPALSRAFALVAVIDPASSGTGLTHFQQMIFVQDRAILENQRPSLLPLDPGAEMPTRADLTSIAYRRWLKEKGVRYGTTAA
jgi:phenylpropionate dioxygenase-like ring-hydroxylating dioxygenase large terminal subunit